jgi:Flp pilus assembly protein TadG
MEMTNGRLKCKELITKLLLRGDAGQSFVEIALTLPVLVVLLVGAAQFATVIYVAIEVSNAARAAVAYGALSTTMGDTTGIKNAAIMDAGNLNPALTTSNVTVSTVGVCSSGAACTGTNSTCTNTDCPSSVNPGDQIETILTVDTSYNFRPAIHIPGFPASYTLHGHATQICLPQ